MRQNKLINFKINWAHILLLSLATINYLICYPGMLTADSYGQYKQSIDLSLNNHHPPLMGIVWHYLNYLYAGPQLMLLLSLAMIWVSVFLLYETFKDYSKSTLFLLLVPFTPGILSNSAIIWKDVLFGNSVLLALSIATYCFFKSTTKRIRYICYGISLLLLYFGTSIKFQGQFIAPLLICVITYAHFKTGFRKTILSSLVVFILFCTTNTIIENHFKVQNTNSAQLRQFFDIAGISVCIDEDLFPAFIKADPRYSFEKIKDKYNYVEVNGYIGSSQDKLFSGTNDKTDLQNLEHSFYNAASLHPLCYLNHRLRNFLHMIKIGPSIFKEFWNFSLPEEAKSLYNFESSFFVLSVSKYISSLKLFARNSIFLAINLVFTFLFIRLLKRNKLGKMKPQIHLCLLINALCWYFYLILFFTTMAADHRYLYLNRALISFYLPLQIATLYNCYISPIQRRNGH